MNGKCHCWPSRMPRPPPVFPLDSIGNARSKSAPITVLERSSSLEPSSLESSAAPEVPHVTIKVARANGARVRYRTMDQPPSANSDPVKQAAYPRYGAEMAMTGARVVAERDRRAFLTRTARGPFHAVGTQLGHGARSVLS